MVLTIAETSTFQRLWPAYWTEEERAEFAAYLAQFPEIGDVVKGAGGVRKVRWSRKGGGKSGGVRVIYYKRLANGEIVLLFLYAKNEFDSIAADKLKELKMPSKKPMDDKALHAWEGSRDMAAELEQSMQEMLAGQGKPVAISPVVVARMQSGLSQGQFAKLLGVSLRTLQEWEQGRRNPSGAAQTLLKIALRHPDVLQGLA